jgi:nucleotide-binding universal stress UspA family protein
VQSAGFIREDKMKKILVATDGTPGSEKALEWAAAAQEPSEILVVYAIEEFCPVALDEVDCNTIRCLMDKEAYNVIEDALRKLQTLGVTGRAIVAKGEPVEAIMNVAKQEKADEIIAFSHGKRGLAKLLQGSVTSKLAEKAPCPVVIVK